MRSAVQRPVSSAPTIDPGAAHAVNEPAVSIIVPVFNGAPLLGNAVSSVVRQRFQAWELLILDDGSTDNSSGVAAEWVARDRRIRLVRSPSNRGIARTYNSGIQLSRGPLVLILHQDCALVGDDWLDRAIASFDGPDCVAVVGSPLHNVGEMSSVEKLFWIIRSHTAATHPGGPAQVSERLFSENKCDLFRKDLLVELGGFDESLRWGGEDQVLALRIRDKGLRIAQPPRLLFQAGLGSDRTIRQNLGKEWAYGFQMRAVVLHTELRALHRTGEGRLDPWLLNRLSVVGWVTWTVIFLLVGLLLDRPIIALIALAGPLFRVVQLWVRGVRVRRAYCLGWAGVSAIGPLGLVADLAYVVGTLSPPWSGASGSRG